jgi:predicted ATP-grasp superfamily ATP-dependent carboligase
VRIFVYEFVTGGGLAGAPLPHGLAREADLMVRALINDLARIPGVVPLATRDPRLPPLPGCETLPALAGEDPLDLYSRGLARADAGWPTAPETGGVLERLARRTLDQGKRLLGCRPGAVRLAASKHATAAALRAAGIPAVPTFAAAGDVPALPGPWVVKPDDGAGCDGTVRVADWRGARQCLEEAPGRLVAQPWVEGHALSLSLLCADGRGRLLCCNRQHIRVREGRVSLAGIEVNAVADLDRRLGGLARDIAAAIPSLWGYVGVDLVQGEQGTLVLEINPRLTTSYCGLARALGINPAAMVLDLLREQAPLLEFAAPCGSPVAIALDGADAR